MAARPPSTAEKRREELKIKIATLFDSFDGAYGYRRIHAELVRAGEHVGEELVRKLMRELNLVAVQPKPYKRTTIPGKPEQAVADLVARDFTADKPGLSASATSPTSRRGKAGCMWRQSLTASTKR
ncbi:hypothetical protein MDOR_11450 [Mycolicibacterium doricum]|uniref:HTH-like domain-containing protein n=1 Tax=Mycolicibacterium doricum TaxID=126673 RepID=A0A7I7VNW0_9MYCO|nr:hypothetical protein MDOR_11450 [Mycolicibacterium doricum]